MPKPKYDVYVIWLTSSDDLRPDDENWNGVPLPKRTIRLTIPWDDRIQKWTEWIKKWDVDKEFISALAEAGGGMEAADTWYVCEEELVFRESVTMVDNVVTGCSLGPYEFAYPNDMDEANMVYENHCMGIPELEGTLFFDE